MIESGNTGYSNGSWFHYGVASGLNNICICQSVRADELMKCKARDKCDRGEYFHKG